MLQQQKIAITMDNGELVVMSFITVGRGNVLPALATWIDEKNAPGWWRREPTDAAILDELCRAFPEKDGDGNARPQPARYRRISDSELPSDRSYRAAWADDGKAVVHDMPKARALHLGKVRAARAAKLESLDRDWMKATGQGKKLEADRIEAERQTLRDLPTELKLDEARTVGELKARWSPLLSPQ